VNNHISFATAAPAGVTPVVPTGSPLDSSILAEQLTYLLQHAQDCQGACPECARLERIAHVLLEPFHSAAYPVERSDSRAKCPAGFLEV